MMLFDPGRYSKMKNNPDMRELARYTFLFPNRLANGLENGIPAMRATVPIILNN